MGFGGVAEKLMGTIEQLAQALSRFGADGEDFVFVADEDLQEIVGAVVELEAFEGGGDGVARFGGGDGFGVEEDGDGEGRHGELMVWELIVDSQ